MNKEPFVTEEAMSELGVFLESTSEGKSLFISFGKVLFASDPFIRVSLLCRVEADLCVSSLNQNKRGSTTHKNCYNCET